MKYYVDIIHRLVGKDSVSEVTACKLYVPASWTEVFICPAREIVCYSDLCPSLNELLYKVTPNEGSASCNQNFPSGPLQLAVASLDLDMFDDCDAFTSCEGMVSPLRNFHSIHS